MQLPPATVTRLVHLASAMDAAGRGQKTPLKAAACAELDISMGTLHRWLAQVRVAAPRKRRSDAGACALEPAQAQLLSAVLMEGYRANNKKIMSLKKALEICRAQWPHFATHTDPGTGELLPLSAGACARALRQMDLHPQQLRRARAAQPLASDHPNQVWQIDASISTLFYVPGAGEDGLQDMAPGEFYKNKPGNFERIKRQRLTRWVITDHTSGFIFVHYVAGGESVAGMAEAFLAAIQKRDDASMHGVPWMLMMDPGAAGTASAFLGLLRRLSVVWIVNEAGNARAKGQVEKANHLVETEFESGFKLVHVPDLAWINAQAGRWMRYYNATYKHTRHGMTRSAKWREIRAQELRLAPAPELCRQLLVGRAEERTINGPFLRVAFGGHEWDVSAVEGAAIGAKLHLARHPYDDKLAYVVRHEGRRDEVLVEVPQVALDAHGFAVGAAHIGQEYKRPADSAQDQARKRIERFAMGADSDEQAAAARKAKAVPFARLGGIDPYQMFDRLPEAVPLPRRGVPLAASTDAPAARVQAAAARVYTVFELAGELRQLGLEMTPERLELLRQWCPEGARADEIAGLAQRMQMRGALSLVHGGEAVNQ